MAGSVYRVESHRKDRNILFILILHVTCVACEITARAPPERSDLDVSVSVQNPLLFENGINVRFYNEQPLGPIDPQRPVIRNDEIRSHSVS